MAQPNVQTHEGTFPTKHVIGYGLSLILTALAFWVVFGLHFSTSATIATIVVLAVIQMTVQLFLFMHLTERIHGDASQQLFIYLGIGLAAGIVIGTIWIMTFKSAVS